MVFVKDFVKRFFSGCLCVVLLVVCGVSYAAHPPETVSNLVSVGSTVPADAAALGIPLPMAKTRVHKLPAPNKRRSSELKARVKNFMAAMPLHFEPNVGQFAPQVKFAARGRTAVVCTNKGLILRVGDKKISLVAEGGKAQKVYGRQLLRAKVNYFIGNDSKKWHKGVSTYGEVVFHNLYPGIDMVVSGNEGRLTTDFVVYPGADPSAIKLKVKSATPTIDNQGRLVLKAGSTKLAFSAPYSYQAVGGKLKKVDSRFVVKGNAYGFELSRYKKDAPVVIDPHVVWSTYVGGVMILGILRWV